MDEISGGPRRIPGVGKGLTRARGLAILSVIAATGVVLWRLGSRQEPARVVEVSEDPPSTSVLIAGSPSGDPAAALLIVSRLRVAFDPRRSLLSLEDGRERIVPGGAGAILVHSSGQVEAFHESLLSGNLLRLLRSYPVPERARQLREWAAGTKPFPHGVGLDERLRRFLAAP